MADPDLRLLKTAGVILASAGSAVSVYSCWATNGIGTFLAGGALFLGGFALVTAARLRQ